MFEFWHDFLTDSDTFGATVFLLFVFITIGVMGYFMMKENR